MRRIAVCLATLSVMILIAGAVVLWATAPVPFSAQDRPAHDPNMANGEQLFIAGGCLTCHKPAADSALDAALPAGGRALKSPVGTFYPPNITPHETSGIGAWSDAQFINAMKNGVSPGLRHYFPAFPFTSYRYMTIADLLDIKAYLFSLQAVDNKVPEADLPLLPLARLTMGPWKWLADKPMAVPLDPAKGEVWNRGAYLVQGPGHCAECHTPRNVAMVPKGGAAFLAGGPHPEGQGQVPSLRGLLARKRYKDADDLASALAFGETYGYEDISSGGMAAVQENIGRLGDDDIKAIAAFLVSLE